MATPAEKLADSLDALRTVQQKGMVAIKTADLSRTNRERLLDNGYITEVYKGWYMASSPGDLKGSSGAWFSSYWPFCAQVLDDMYGENWCVSPEQSLLIHAGNWTVQQQLIIKSPAAGNNKTELPFSTSLFHIKSKLPAKAAIITVQGVRMLSLPAALTQVSPSIYTQNTIDARTALSLITDAAEILTYLLEEGKSVIAGRLVGAFNNNGQAKIATAISKTMKAAGYDIREADPFDDKLHIKLSAREKSPYVNRLRLMWSEMREHIIEIFPTAPGIPVKIKGYMKQVEEIFVTDAYHSLSIEKYTVTQELIERVRSGAWDDSDKEENKKHRDGMAARGYWQAFQLVEKSVEKILRGENAGKVADDDFSDWYLELFGPSVTAGIVKASDLAGYRNQQVYISGSKHTPLNNDAVRDAMPVLFELLQQETEASVRSVLGHFIFVFIHPYMDGNGRMGRFLMNAMLASGGYPWTVIPVEQRKTYMAALESASAGGDIKPFAKFLAHLVEEGLKGKPVATLNQQQ